MVMEGSLGKWARWPQRHNGKGMASSERSQHWGERRDWFVWEAEKENQRDGYISLIHSVLGQRVYKGKKTVFSLMEKQDMGLNLGQVSCSLAWSGMTILPSNITPSRLLEAMCYHSSTPFVIPLFSANAGSRHNEVYWWRARMGDLFGPRRYEGRD